MARLVTCGFEQQQVSITSDACEGEGFAVGNGGTAGPTIDTGVKRSGAAALKCAKSNYAVWNAISGGTPDDSTWHYLRAYFRFDANPSSASVRVLRGLRNSGGWTLALRTDGKLVLCEGASVGGTQIGALSAALSTGTWYRLEVAWQAKNGGGAQQIQVRLDDAAIVETTASIGSGTHGQILAGDSQNTETPNFYFDDVALNDSSGSAQNSWPGDGAIILLKPVGDNNVSGWSTGSGGDANWWESHNNTPPIGASSPGTQTQTKTTASNITDFVQHNCASYSAAGIPSGNRIALLQGVAQIGSADTTPRDVKVEVNFNPSGTGANTTTPSAAIGASPANWKTGRSAISYAPSVTRGTQPWIRLTRQTSGGTIHADFVGILVEHTPARTAGDTWGWSDAPRPTAVPVAAPDSWGWNDTPGVAPGATPTLAALTVDAYGRVSGVVTGCGTATTIKVYRSTAGSTFADVTANQTITSLGGGSFSFTDKRPSYGSQPVALNATGYWKVAGYITAAGPLSTAQTAVPAIDKPTVELAVWASLHTEMATQATRENTSHLGYAYPGRFLLSAAYVAYQHPSKTTEALTDLDTWWTFVKTQINADNLFIANGYNTHVYPAHNAEMVVYLCACVRMLNRLTGNATAASLSSDMIAKANAIGKAMIDKLARTSLTAAGFGGGTNTTVSGATAWSSGGLVSTGNIIKPSSGATRIWRVITPSLSFASLGTVEPTWPDIDGAIVQSGSIYLQECTNEFPARQNSHAYAVGDMVRPTTRNGRTYRCSTAGTSGSSEPTWSTSNGGTTTDGTVVWTETTRTGDIFDVAYNPTTPYAGPGAPSKIGDEMSRIAAAFSALMNSAATDFTTGGSKRTAANTIALDHAKLAGTLQVGTGALIQQYDWPTDDSLYASYTIHLLAVAIHEQGDSWLPELAASVDKTLAWFSSTYSTEPTVGNEEAGRPTTSTSSLRADIGWRDAAFRTRGTVNPITNTYWESCLHPGSTYTQAGQAAGTEGNDLNYLSTLGVPAAFSIPQTATATDAWGWSDTPAATTTKARAATDAWGWSDSSTSTRLSNRGTSDSWGWSDSAVEAVSRPRDTNDTWNWSDSANRDLVLEMRGTNDAWNWNDSTTRDAQTLERITSDIWNWNDGATGTSTLDRITSDAWNWNDDAVGASTPSRVTNDTWNWSESTTGSASKPRVTDDAWNWSDNTDRGLVLGTRNTSDTWHWSDGAQIIVPGSTGDTWNWSDTSKIVARVTITGDVWNWNESTLRTLARSLTTSDSWNWSDSVARTKTGPRTTSDTWGWNESATGVRIGIFNRNTSDTWHWSDSGLGYTPPYMNTDLGTFRPGDVARGGGRPRSVPNPAGKVKTIES